MWRIYSREGSIIPETKMEIHECGIQEITEILFEMQDKLCECDAGIFTSVEGVFEYEKEEREFIEIKQKNENELILFL